MPLGDISFLSMQSGIRHRFPARLVPAWSSHKRKSLIEEDTGENKVWQIVGEPEADAHKGNISVTSPIARGLIGKTKGETVEVEAPGGAKVYQIRKVGGLGAPSTDELPAFKLATFAASRPSGVLVMSAITPRATAPT